MPEIFRLFGLRFLFYANDHQPIHVHVVKGKGSVVCEAKFTIEPVELIANNGLSKVELKMAEAIIEENKEIIAQHWNKFFNNDKG